MRGGQRRRVVEPVADHQHPAAFAPPARPPARPFLRAARPRVQSAMPSRARKVAATARLGIARDQHAPSSPAAFSAATAAAAPGRSRSVKGRRRRGAPILQPGGGGHLVQRLAPRPSRRGPAARACRATRPRSRSPALRASRLTSAGAMPTARSACAERLRQRMRRAAPPAPRRPQGLAVGCSARSVGLGAPSVSVPGLVEHHRIDLGQPLQRRAVLDQQPLAEQPP